jgi:hypothetical protein
MSILMGIIADLSNNRIIAQYPTSSRNIVLNDHRSMLTDQIIPSITHNNQMRVLEHSSCYYYIKILNELIFIGVADKECKNRTCWAFLDSLIDSVSCQQQVQQQQPKHLQKLIHSKIKYFNDPKSEKISQLYDRIDDLMEVQSRNIDTILERGDKLSDVLSSSETMHDTTKLFYKGTVKCLPWYIRLKLWIKKVCGKGQVRKPTLKSSTSIQQQQQPQQQIIQSESESSIPSCS